MQNAFMRYKDELLLEYDQDIDCYTLSYDDGFRFPYEMYEMTDVNNNQYYIIYLDDKNEVPTTSKDLWLELDKVLPYLQNFKSTTTIGREAINQLKKIIEMKFTEL